MSTNRRHGAKPPSTQQPPSVSVEEDALFLSSVALLGVPDRPQRQTAAPQVRAATTNAAARTSPAHNKATERVPRANHCTAEEAALFESAFASLGSEPTRNAPPPLPAPPQPSPPPSNSPKELPITVTADLDMATLISQIDADERVSEPVFSPPVVARQSLPDLPSEKKFRAALEKRRLGVGATLDLHGFTADRAVDLLRAFVREAVLADLRVVLVIHGKGLHSPGDPVLRDLVRRLLRDELAPMCRLITTAPPNLGGSGATAVLLKPAERAPGTPNPA